MKLQRVIYTTLTLKRLQAKDITFRLHRFPTIKFTRRIKRNKIKPGSFTEKEMTGGVV